MCELLRAGGADGAGGRTCTFISRFWRPLLYIKLRLQKMPGISTGRPGLIHSNAADTPRRLHAAKRNRNGQLRICPPQTQKPQGGFPFLTAFDSIIIPLLQGAFEGQKMCLTKRETDDIISAWALTKKLMFER